ncbi:MAG: radical SAM protein [Acidilobaceae archaeon]
MAAYRFMDWEISLRSDSAPKALMVEVTSSCNYVCPHCFRFSSVNFREQDMSVALFEKTIENALRSGVKRIVFSGWGEPTIHPNIIDMLALTKSKGLQVVLNTNGFRLEELAPDLVKLGVDEIYVSIDAFDVELYSKIRRGGNLSRVARGLLALKEEKLAKGSLKPYVKAIFTITKANVSHISKAVEFAKEMMIWEVDYNIAIPYDSFTKSLDCLGDPVCLKSLEKELETALLKVLESGVRVGKPNLKTRSSRSCPFATNRMLFVRSDGQIAPCIYYSRTWTTIVGGVKREVREVSLGNVAEMDLSEVWRSNSRQLMMLQLLLLPSCLDCELVSSCSITLSNSFDCWGNAPSCSSCPYLHGLSFCPS